LDVRQSRRKDAAANSENFAADAYSFGKVSGDMGERGQEEIAEIVADEAASSVKAILKKAAKKSFIFRECHHAIANVARRKDTVLAAKAAGATSVIGDGNDGSKFRNWPVRIGVLVAPSDDVFLEAAQKGGKSGASSKRYNSESVSERPRFVRFSVHRVTQ
jgi:hypothetical protein